MAARGADALDARQLRRAAQALLLVLAVDALHERGIDALELRQDERTGVAAPGKPARDVELEGRRRLEPEQRELRHRRALARGQAVVGEGQDAGAERVADQDRLARGASRARVREDRREIARHALGRLRAPEVAQAVDAHDAHAAAREDFRQRLVEIAPAAVARVHDREEPARHGRAHLDQRQPGERRGAGRGGFRREQRRDRVGDALARSVAARLHELRAGRRRRECAQRVARGSARRDAQLARQLRARRVGEAVRSRGGRDGAGAQRHARRERFARIDEQRARDGRGRRLRERRVGERSARADTGEQWRAVALVAELALELLRERLDLRHHVVAAVVAGGEAAQVLRQIDAHHGRAARRERARVQGEILGQALVAGEEEHEAVLGTDRTEERQLPEAAGLERLGRHRRTRARAVEAPRRRVDDELVGVRGKALALAEAARAYDHVVVEGAEAVRIESLGPPGEVRRRRRAVAARCVAQRKLPELADEARRQGAAAAGLGIRREV